MASADLDHIRALLIAQTAAPEPRRRTFGMLGPRGRPSNPPLVLAEPVRRAGEAPADADQGLDQEILLSYICAPETPEPAPSPFVPETVSLLPPPRPRAAFGRRREDEAPELLLARAGADDPPIVPYFPEDLAEEAHELEALFSDREPMRPWIKALRTTARPSHPAPSAPEPPPPAEPAPIRAASLSHNLLVALESTLSREQHQLDDRIAALSL
jgi:hypothetical protein